MSKLDQLLKQLKLSPTSDKVASGVLLEVSKMLLEYIGQGAIIADVLGRVEYINPIAEQHLGWTQAEIHGQPVSKIVRMMNQATGLPMANPVRNVLVQGKMVTLPPNVAMVRRNEQLMSAEGERCAYLRR